MQHLKFDNITTDTISLFNKKGIDAAVLRLDKIHPVISGNKWFKLQYYIKEATEQQKKKIVTFGGAYSNHIIAVAAACKLNELASSGIIRGEEPSVLSPTLLQAEEYGMKLYFISRKDYSEKKIPGELQNEEYYFIPEGGYGKNGAAGAGDILNYAKKDPIAIGFTHCCCAAGTGTMMAGLVNAALPHQKIIGISVLKNNFESDSPKVTKDRMEENVRPLLNNEQKEWQIIHDYHFGGYAKHKPSLINFMNEFYRQTNIPSDFVYTGKLFYAIADLVKNNFFPPGSKLLLIHSGGLQGNISLGKGTLIF